METSKKDLQIVAGNFIMESNLTKVAKHQLLNFIQHEANKEQIMALMLDGEIVKLDEQSKQIVNERFESKFGEPLNELDWKAKAAIAGAAIVGTAYMGANLWAAWRHVQTTFSFAANKCGTYRIGVQRESYSDIANMYVYYGV